MNILKKIRNIFFISILLFLGIKTVSADSNTLVRKKWSRVYAVHEATDKKHLYKAEIYTLNGDTAYCLEIGVPIDTETYSSTENWDITKLSPEEQRYVRLVAYYGYDYKGHKKRNYYLAAQELIWEKLSGRNVYWVTGLLDVDAPKLDIETEKNEILNLVNNHDKKPSFNNNEIEVNLNETKSINDDNNILSQFQIYDNGFQKAKISGNTLNITPTKSTKNQEVQLVKKSYTNKVNLIYYNGSNQKLVRAGYLDPVISKVKVKVTSGNITLKKLDSETGEKPQGDAKLTGAEYGIYNSSNKLVDTIVIGTRDKSIDLPYGKYTIKERKAPLGYKKNKTVYEVTIDGSNEQILLDVKDEVIKRKINLFKMYANDNKTELMTGEANVTFEFYLKSSNKLYTSATTDDKGQLTVTLPYGTYIVRQTTSSEGHDKMKDFEIVVDENMPNPYNKVISNAEIRSKLKLIKIDSNSKKMIVKDGIKFRIKNLDTGEYVCQNMTYPNQKKVCVFETKGGYFITPDTLPYGNYQIEELDQSINGYLWNKTPFKFSINENSNFIYDDEYGVILEVQFENEEVKGEVFVEKLGETLVKENKSFHYEEKKLDGVVYELYANDNIYSGDGTLVHKKGDLIGTYTTKDGNIHIEDLYLGKYYLVEKSTVDGHVLDTTKHYFELKYKDQYTPIVTLNFTFKNHLKKGKLEFTKEDLTTGKPIPNTKIEIHDADTDEVIFSGVTDKNGKIIISDLYVGTFYIVETEPATGYKLSNEKVYFEIKDNGDIVKCSMTNEQIVKVPKTGANKSSLPNIISLLFIISGVGYIVYANKKKK